VTIFLCVYTQGTKLAVVSSEDLITILASNPRMKSPSKHRQTIGGNVILVNSYTQKDKDLLENAIKWVA